MATASCTLVGQTYNNSAWGTYNPGQACYAGYDTGGTHYTTIIKFKTPSFSGKTSKLTVTFPTQNISGYYNSQWPDIRYALCTSDANKQKYRDTTSAVSDTYQLLSGYKEIAAGNTVTLTFETSALQPNTHYYVFIWGGDSYSKFQINLYPSATLTYTENRTVTYTYGGESIADKKTNGVALTLRGVSFYRNGYSQIGWSTSEGGEITHSFGASYATEANLTLYPVWGIAPKVVLWLLLKRGGKGIGS